MNENLLTALARRTVVLHQRSVLGHRITVVQVESLGQGTKALPYWAPAHWVRLTLLTLPTLVEKLRPPKRSYACGQGRTAASPRDVKPYAPKHLLCGIEAPASGYTKLVARGSTALPQGLITEGFWCGQPAL